MSEKAQAREELSKHDQILDRRKALKTRRPLEKKETATSGGRRPGNLQNVLETREVRVS